MPIPVDRFVSIAITRATRTVTRRGFGMLLIAAYHTAWADRVRSYADPADMLLDGFVVTDAAYLAAIAAKSQDPSLQTFKIGRRVGAPVQSIRFTPATPTALEAYSLKIAGVTFAVAADASPTVAEVAAAFTLLINSDADAIITSGVASTTGVQTITSASFNGIRGGTLAPPRNVTLTLNSHADWDATTIVVTGTDANGLVQTESYSVPNGGNTTLVGTKVFATVTSIAIPAQSGTGGTLQVGVGTTFASAHLDVTATDGTTHFDVIADAAGKWFPYTAPTANLSIEDRTAVPATALATDLAAMQAEDADWYGLVVADAQSSAQITAIATWAETQALLYCAHSIDSAIADPSITTDVASTLKASARVRSWVFYNRLSHGLFPDAAIFGKMFPQFDAGEAVPSFAFKELAGILTDEYTTAQVDSLIGAAPAPFGGKRVMIYSGIAPRGVSTGTPATLGGTTAGERWLDSVWGQDFLTAEIQTRTIDLLLSSPRVPYTEAGIDRLLGAVRAALNLVSARPYRILDPASITVQAAALADVASADRNNRYYNGIRFDAREQGAIHAVRFVGTLAA